MRVTKEVTETKSRTATVDVLCNKCGGSLCSNIDHQRNAGVIDPEAYGLVEVQVRGAYFSKVLEDMTSYTFSICETCLGEMFDGFKIPVVKADLDY